MDISKALDEHIQKIVNDTLQKKLIPDTEYIETDNLGELIEKLVILHIRTWMLEDAIQEATKDSDIAELKRKIDICFKQKRPKFVQAINLMVENAIIHNKTLREDSVKLYKGIS